MADEFPFELRFKGKPISPQHLIQDPDFSNSDTSVIAAGFDVDDPSRVHAFRSTSEFDDWVQTTNHSGKVRSARSDMEKIKGKGDRDREAIVRQHDAEMKRVTKEAERLSRETGLRWPSPELFRIGHDRGIFHSIVLCDLPNYSMGALGWRLFNIPGIPDLNWVGFNDATTSYFVSGFGAMYEHPWYGGRAFWTIGVPIWGVPDLRAFGWDNIASSLWITGP